MSLSSLLFIGFSLVLQVLSQRDMLVGDIDLIS